MIDQAQTDKLREILESSKQALVILPAASDLDLLLASYCLYVFLSQRLSARLLCPKPFGKLPSALVDLLDQSKLETELGKENLLISFPYHEEQVDKVSYYIGEQDHRFYLTIKPKQGTAPLDDKQVEFSYAGAEADLVFLCGVDNLEDLEQLYFGYEPLYQSSNSHLITLNHFIPDFGTLSLDLDEPMSYCEALYFTWRNLDLKTDVEIEGWLSADVASLLLYGIEHKSQGLQGPNTAATTFLAVGELLQAGAKRLFQLASNNKKAASVDVPKSNKNKRISNESHQHHLLK